GRLLSRRGGWAGPPAGHDRDGAAPGISRLLSGDDAPDLLSLVGSPPRRASRRLGETEVQPHAGLPDGLGHRPDDRAGVRPDEARPLLPPRLSGLCAPRGLAGEPARRGGHEPASLA